MSERNLSANILRSTSLGHALTDMYWVVFPALLPLIQKEFALSYAQAGLLITSFIVTAGLGSFITGSIWIPEPATALRKFLLLTQPSS